MKFSATIDLAALRAVGGRIVLLLTLLLGTSTPVPASDDEKKADAPAVEAVEQPAPSNEDEVETVLPKYQDMILPSGAEFLRSKPFDWIVLKNNDVIVTEPIGPRPETLVILGAEYERYLKGRAGFREGVEKLAERRRQFQRLTLTLTKPGVDQEPDYVLETKLVQKIDYFEDLILRRANLTIDEENIPLAYDLLMLVDRRHRENNARLTEAYQANRKDEAANATNPEERQRYTVPDAPPLRLNKTWPKFDETYQHLLFVDAVLHFRRGEAEPALRILEDLWDRNAGYPELSSQFGQVVDRLMSVSVEQSDYRQARYFLGRLTARDPQHSVAAKWRSELLERTSAMIAEARNVSAQGDASLAASLIDRAARIWPETPGLKDAHRELNERFQSVRLGLLRLSGEPTSYPFDAAAESDSRNLRQQPLFEAYRVDERGVRYRSNVLEAWEPMDLGRQVQFTLRLKRAEWEARALITATDIHRELAAKLDPTMSVYDERLAGFIENVEVVSPSQFNVHFRRLPLRLEALLQFPVSLADPSALNPDLPAGALPHAGRERFYKHARNEREVSYRRVRSQSLAIKNRNVDEIVTVRYENWDRALQGLLRGEVAGISHASLKDVKALQDDNRFFVIPYALPVTHLITFNPRSAPLKDAQLRRALTIALPREELVTGTITHDSLRRFAKITATPFPSTSYGHNRLLQEPPYDPQRAAALALTAKKQLGGELPVLRFVCAPDPLVKGAAVQMVEHWRRIGLTVQLIDAPDSSPDQWDLAYRTTKVVEPLTELWPLLTLQSRTDVESLRPLPERMRRQLLELERSNDWTSATNLLHRVESELLVESRFIPLWEVDDFFVTRRHLIGLPSRLMHAYHDVERWTLQSWYPQESP